jgi:hypothetical protein
MSEFECYNKDCKKMVDYQATGSFFCCQECKAAYNKNRRPANSAERKLTVPEMQEKLKAIAAALRERRLNYQPSIFPAQTQIAA